MSPAALLLLGRGQVEQCPPCKHEDRFVAEDQGPQASLVVCRGTHYLPTAQITDFKRAVSGRTILHTFSG